ncbi:hypothetical protein [Marinimicrobium locisalis]|uniref:hypothetical protein n=1 Tax=Marinimicrobium locisalis TaxID=546022 RepID=UPI0032221A16
MLQKLLIALCTIFVLTACGGDDDASQEPIVLNPPEDLNSGEEEGEEEGGTEDDGPWLSQQFETDTSASWSFACISGCNTTAELTHNADEQTLNVTPTWGAAEDQIEVSATINPEIADLTAGNAHLKLYVPASYTDAGTINAQVFFVNAADAKGYLGFMAVSAGWNTFSFTDIQLGTEEGSFGYQTEAFTLENIKAIGVQVDPADGVSLVDVSGTLQLDDVIVSDTAISVDEKASEPVVLEPLATGDESFTFASDAEGWTNDNSDGSSVSHDADANALVITPDWASDDEGGNRPKAMGVTTSVVSEATIRMIVTVTQAQVDGGLGVQPYIQQNSGSYSQEFGATVTDLVAGDNAITFSAPALADAMRVGVQLVGPITSGESDVVLIKQVEIDLPDSGTVEPTAEIVFPFTDGIEGWSINGEAAGTQTSAHLDLTHDATSGALVMTPKDWSVDNWRLQAGTSFSATSDLSGATINATVNMPASYVTDGTLNFQFVIAHDGGDAYVGYTNVAGLTAGENDVTVDLSGETLTGATSIAVQLATPPTDTTILDPISVLHLEVDLVN